MTYISQISYRDGATLDSFGRVRISEPQMLWGEQLTRDLSPLTLEQVVSGTGASITHDATNRMAVCAFSSTATGGKAYLQTYETFRYQPGKSTVVDITFNFLAHVANCLKFVGYSDGTNGVELQSNGSALQFVLYSATTNGNQTVLQSSWNVDKLDGTGASGKTLDVAKAQILVIDFQALYVGRVRVGFNIDGVTYIAHEFKHANSVAYPYIQSANLPLRFGMTCTGTVTASMRYICSAVSTEGGVDDVVGGSFSIEGTATAGSGARTHVLSLRPRTTFNSLTNRARFLLDSIDVLVTGTNPVLWELCIGQAITGASYADVNTTYSAMQYSAGTISGSPSLVIAQGYAAASATTKTSVSYRVSQRYPITLDAAGAVRALGTLSLIATGIGGSSAMRASFNWKELG